MATVKKYKVNYFRERRGYSVPLDLLIWATETYVGTKEMLDDHINYRLGMMAWAASILAEEHNWDYIDGVHSRYEEIPWPGGSDDETT